MSPGVELHRLLLDLRLVGLAPVGVLASRLGAGPEAVDAALRLAAERGWVIERGGRFAGWMLSPAGRAELGERLAQELDSAGGRDAVVGLYGRFLPLNADLLDVCARWQVRTDESGVEIPNPHDDPAEDDRVLDRLGSIHVIAVQLLAELAALSPRFSGYVPRLDGALVRVRAGDREWFTRPTIDSYHTVWFELHEHLLAVLGRSRAEERS